MSCLEAGSRELRFEIASMGARYHVIKADDAEAIAPIGRNEQGYLAVLDIAEPVRWAPIEYPRIRHRLGRQPLATTARARRSGAGESVQ